MTNICFITALFIAGGSDQLLFSLCSRLRKRGHTITIYSLFPSSKNDSMIRKFESIGVSIISPIKLFNAPYHKIPYLYQLALFIRFWLHHRKHHYDIISGYHAATYPVLFWIKKQFRILVYYTEISSPKWRRMLNIKPLGEEYINLFNAIFVPSKLIGEELILFEGLKKPYTVIPFSLDLPPYHFLPPCRSAKTFGVIARLSPEKNPDLLIRILKLVKNDFPDAKLILIGTGPLKQQLITIAISLGLLDEVHFVDNFEKIEDVVGLIDIFTLLSDVEGMPLSIIEALYFGKPVIATPVGSIPDMIVDGYNGYIIDKNKIQDIADHIIELMKNFSLYTMMSQNSRLIYESNFDPDTLFSELLLHY